jgi:hypothetical protein
MHSTTISASNPIGRQGHCAGNAADSLTGKSPDAGTFQRLMLDSTMVRLAQASKRAATVARKAR